MSEEQLEEFPYVLVDRIECEYLLKNYENDIQTYGNMWIVKECPK